MAGSYHHVITDNGNLGSNEYVADMLENGGDVFEGVEEMFGMIWYLAHKLDGSADEESLSHEDRVKKYEDVKLAVEEARQNYKHGLEISKDIHAIAPDHRED